MEKRIEKIETDFTYLQDEVRQLNETVAELQAVVSRLGKQNEFLANRLDELDTEARPNRRPPHY